MPLSLPPGYIATPVIQGLDSVISGPRVTGYRFDLFDANEQGIGTLDSVQPGGSVEFHAYSSVKGSGRITVTDLGQAVDWLNVRIRPVALISGVGYADPDTEVSCGLFLASAPVEKWTVFGRSWEVELMDKLAILDQDIVIDGSGDPVTYTVLSGVNILDTVVDLIEGAGETAPAIGTSTKVLAAPMVWEVGTTRLKIINDLLEAGNFFSLWCDGNGQYQATPYVAPASRPPVYEMIAPFTKGEDSLMHPDWTRDRDIYSIPNRYVVIGQGDGTTEALTAVATNTSSSSPFSYANRGNRWVTRVETGVEATGQTDLDAHAARALLLASTVSSGFAVSHIYLPEVQINRTIKFINPDAGLDILTYVIVTTIPFDPTALASSELREATV